MRPQRDAEDPCQQDLEHQRGHRHEENAGVLGTSRDQRLGGFAFDGSGRGCDGRSLSLQPDGTSPRLKLRATTPEYRRACG
jgi:hypothetical protein